MRTATPLAALLLGAACNIPPAPEAELDLELRAEWAAANPPGERPRDAWWESFGDAELDGAILEALEHNRDLVLSATRVRAAAAQARIAEGALLPTLDGGLSRQRQKQVFVGLPIPGTDVPSNTFNSWGVDLTASWEADLWGRLSAEERAAQDHRADEKKENDVFRDLRLICIHREPLAAGC